MFKSAVSKTEARRHALVRTRPTGEDCCARRTIEGIRFQKCGGGRRIIRKRLGD